MINILLIWFWKLFGDTWISKDDAQTLFAQGEYQEFVDTTNNNVDTYDDIVYRRGLAFLKLWQYDKALESFLTSYKVLKSNVNVGMMKSLWLFLKEDYDSVEETLKVLGSPNLFEQSAIHLLRWINFYHRGNLWSAKNFIINSLDWDPISPIAYHYLGRIALDQRKWNLAKNYLIKSSDQWYVVDSQNFYLAQAYIELDETEEASLILEQFPNEKIDVLDDPSVYYLTQAKLAKQKEDRATSLAFYNKVLDQDPTNQSLYTLIGKMYLDQWDIQKAQATFQEWYDYDQTNTNFLVDQYIVFATSENQDTKNKKELFSKILTEIWSNQTKYDYAAKTLYEEGLFTEAHVFVDRLLTINPNHRSGKNTKRNILTQSILSSLRQQEPVDEKFEDILDRFPNDSIIVTLLSTIQANEWNQEDALNTLNLISTTFDWFNYSEIVAWQLSYALLEWRWWVEELIEEFVSLRQKELLEDLEEYEASEPLIENIVLEQNENELTEVYTSRIEQEYQRVYTAWKRAIPSVEDDYIDRTRLLLQRMLASFVDKQRDYASQSELVEIDFRFSEDDFIKSEAQSVLGNPYKRLSSFYGDIDTLFIKDS